MTQQWPSRQQWGATPPGQWRPQQTWQQTATPWQQPQYQQPQQSQPAQAYQQSQPAQTYQQAQPGQAYQPGQLPQPTAYQPQAYQQPQYQQPAYQPYQPYQPTGYSPVQPNWQPPTYRPPAVRKHTARSIFIALIGLVLVGAFAVSLMNYLSGRSRTTGNDPLPTWSTSAPDPDPTSSTSTPGNVDVPEPDRNPPDLPEPETYSEATKLMQDNALYGQVTVPTQCVVDDIDITTASKSELERHLNELTACLWMVWNAPVTNAGYELPRPPVTVYTSSVTTGCGRIEDLNAVYCSADQRVYYARDIYEIIPKSLRTSPFIADTIIAHEFGHAVQARTGILISVHAWEERKSTKNSEAEEYSRRTEMQADCFAGAFAQAVAQANSLDDSELAALAELIYNLGDDVLSGEDLVADHGSGEARSRWFNAGLADSSVGACNTYTADSAAVR
ncbi:MAG: neutral zinc metallopeptidase [Propionibacteriaceae bacterium]|nr:neutral zinc metallopeptidase [Propionibacteriaceae bacterium]